MSPRNRAAWGRAERCVRVEPETKGAVSKSLRCERYVRRGKRWAGVRCVVIALRIGLCVRHCVAHWRVRVRWLPRARLFQLDASHLAQGPVAFAEELLEGHGRLGLEPEGTRALVLATPVARLLCYDEVLARVRDGSKTGAGRDGWGQARAVRSTFPTAAVPRARARSRRGALARLGGQPARASA